MRNSSVPTCTGCALCRESETQPNLWPAEAKLLQFRHCCPMQPPCQFVLETDHIVVFFSLFFSFFYRMTPNVSFFSLLLSSSIFEMQYDISAFTDMSRIESWLYFSCFFLFIVIDLRDRNADAILDSRTRSSKNILRVLNFVFLKMKDEHLNKRRSSFEIIRFE